jgi:hypothetical protein
MKDWPDEDNLLPTYQFLVSADRTPTEEAAFQLYHQLADLRLATNGRITLLRERSEYLDRVVWAAKHMVKADNQKNDMAWLHKRRQALDMLESALEQLKEFDAEGLRELVALQQEAGLDE